MKFNLKEQIKSCYFWLSMLSLVTLTAQFMGFKLPEGLDNYVNSVLMVLVGLGIINDNTVSGLGAGKQE